ncbi:DUF4112 domain-containing protein [Rhodovulum sp. DZ06]|uniref:DUF4112 domain-containing protein n=1 Tax=Rhodovulum sp. DZ06 TaxID=3425126 RepID=UPI003D331348
MHRNAPAAEAPARSPAAEHPKAAPAAGNPKAAPADRDAAARAETIARVEAGARMLDARFGIPFTPFRIGWDGLLGLIPGIGDAVMLLPATWMLGEAARAGARRSTMIRMGLNWGIDFAIGAIPLLGDLFDIAWKANLRNAALLRADLESRG